MLISFENYEDTKMVPEFEQMMKPILYALQDAGGTASIGDLDKATIEIMKLPEQVTQIIHKGSRNRSEVSHRMAWARTYLKRYGLINNETRGVWSFTDQFDGDIEKIDPAEILREVGNNEEEDMLSVSSLAFENMICGLLKDLAKKDGKEMKDVRFCMEYDGSDFLLPDGLAELPGETRCVVKYFDDTKRSVVALHNELSQYFSRVNDSPDYRWLVITNTTVPTDVREKIKGNIIVWDKETINEKIEPEAEYVQYVINPKQAVVENAIMLEMPSEQQSDQREQYIAQVKNAFHKQNIVLFLGAGVSKDGGMPLWDTLVKKLHIYMLNQITNEKVFNAEEQEMLERLAYNNEIESPLLQMRYIKTAFSDENYYKLLHKALYDQETSIDTPLFNAIAKISAPQRGYYGVKSIITYNFDDLLEMKFDDKEIQFKVISDEEENPSLDKLNIYHVHGYLPKDENKISMHPQVIFSEEEYHQVYRDSYSWANLVQLNALRESTCLFIGSSLTDPNLRRLLDVANRNGEKPRHYAFMKKNIMKSQGMVSKRVLELYQNIDTNIQTVSYQNLGLNIIWVDEYEEIPKILKELVK